MVADTQPTEKGMTLRVAEAVTSWLSSRLSMARVFGFTFNGRRNLQEAFGFADSVSVAEYRWRYERGGIAGRLVDALPMATWRGGVELVENDNEEKLTAFEQDWKNLDEQLGVIDRLLALDILAQISYCAVLVIVAPGLSNTELPHGAPGGLSDFRPFLGSAGDNPRNGYGMAANFAEARVVEIEQDRANPRFGKPTMYEIRQPQSIVGTASIAADLLTSRVHWTRTIHVPSARVLDDQLYGRPALERSWNDLDSYEKVIGGGAEAFFRRANGATQYDVDKDLKDLSAAEKEAFSSQIEEIEHGFKSHIRTRGVKVNRLGSDVAQFGPNADALITTISGANAIPKRILTGSEMGELASSQDRENWADQVNGRRMGYAKVRIVRALARRLIEYGYLTAPVSGSYDARFSSINTLTEAEKQAKALGWSQTKTEEGETFSNNEIRALIYGMDPQDAVNRVDPRLPVTSMQADVASKLAAANKMQGATLVTDDEIRKLAFGFEPLAPEQKVPITAPERVSATAPTPAVDAGLRAAEDAGLVRLLEEAIGADDLGMIGEILGCGAPDQPRDEKGQWTSTGFRNTAEGVNTETPTAALALGAKTGVPFDATLYRGSGAANARIPSQFAVGEYLSPFPEIAATYGPNVEEKPTRLGNPYVMSLGEGAYFKELKKEFGTRDPGAITSLLIGRGHDGLIVKNVPANRGDVSMRDSIEVVVFK